MATPGDPDYKRGRLAYEAFWAASGIAPQPFETLVDSNLCKAWTAAALAVAADVLTRPDSSGTIPRPRVTGVEQEEGRTDG